MENKLDIFAYNDYRSWLQDSFTLLKKKENMTFRLLARRAGFSSHAFIKEVIDHKKNLSPASAAKLGRALYLTGRELRYLEALAKFQNEEEPAEKSRLFNELLNLKPASEAVTIKKKYFELFSNWYVLAIREMVNDPDFNEKPEVIAGRLGNGVTAAKVKKAVSLLVECGYLKRNYHGLLEQSQPVLTTGDEVDSHAVTAYHQNMLELASRAIPGVNEEWRDISAMSFLINRDEFYYIKNRIRDFRKEMIQYIEEHRNRRNEVSEVETSLQLYQLNMQLFGLTLSDWKVPPSKET